MVAHWFEPLERRYGLDLRSLALLRVGLALVILADLWCRWGDLLAHYSDQGVVPRSLLGELWQPGYWSIHALSGAVWWQGVCFAIATFSALLMLIGYRTRWATVLAWVMVISLHNRNPLIVFAADDVLRAILFWAMFLPLGSSYSVDQALNTSSIPQPQRILTGATLGLMVQQCYIYMFSALFKTTSQDWWPDGTAVYYSLSFDQYVTPLGSFLLHLGPLLTVFTLVTLVLEWLGPLLLWSPIKTDLCRMVAVVVFILLHLGFGLTLNLGIFPTLSCVTWLAFIPTSVWDRWAKRAFTPKQLGLKIYYDADCGFCKKVVHLLRTFLVLPSRVPLQIAQGDPVIQTAMETHNSWVIVDWQGGHHYKWQGIAYVVSLSPVCRPLAKVLRWSPLMAFGTRIYEIIANNRRFAGNFTKPFNYQSFTVRPTSVLSLVTLFVLLLITLWNLRSITSHYAFVDNQQLAPLRRVTNSRTLQKLAPLGQATRLDQSWSIFSPGPPKDDGWYVGIGTTADGERVNSLQPRRDISFEKPSLKQRRRLYGNMQWRTYFINLGRQRGRLSWDSFGQYLCVINDDVVATQLTLMDERTVAPGETQSVSPQLVFEHKCP
ncbi:DCC1-like thiol-disulfide oxidoreductase family protein [Leptothoe spongobia]|uniref:HTTM domain-containing protein n=1 Tax=Leptothoe spongobia TAU-MAC 1115 TaxID=1967444 RepID=A0A947DGM6_9CYAN|nr:HTTM domain-containing protein [Leptothoe spongobia]MBT9316395.1 HTTM domain-containing protein [Leptothoe spongobia TAU-MAC 1115]